MRMIISASLCLLLSAGMISAATIRYTNGAKPFISIIPFSGAGFGYDGDVAPQFWPEMYSTCGGVRQSPVNLMTSNAVNKAYPELKLKGFDKNVLGSVIHNNGHTGKMTYLFL
jgi:carbonic anhydrase